MKAAIGRNASKERVHCVRQAKMSDEL
jgi:hypothetical protein